MRHLYLIVVFFVSVTSFSYGQDIHLSQFYTSDHLLNPARVGDIEGDFRVIGNYRNQWREISKPISTFIISYDQPFHYYSHEIDFGIMVARDEFVGFDQVTIKYAGSIAYSYLYNGHKLRFGLQGGLVSKSTDLKLQTFPVQWDYTSGSFDQNAANMESSLSDTQKYFDLNSGVQWNKKYGKYDITGGFALNHINRPKDTYFGTFTKRLKSRKVAYSEINYEYNDRITLQPKFLMMWTTNANDFLLGSNVKYTLPNKIITSVFGGVFYRHGVKRELDAFYPIIGCSYKQFDFGFSYDFNVSALSKQVKRKSSFEVSLIYTELSSKTKYKVQPCDRY